MDSLSHYLGTVRLVDGGCSPPVQNLRTQAKMPVRTSKRSKAQAEALSAIDVRDVDFGHLWRQLVRVGWTSKRPTRLSNLHSYYPPNAAKELHIEGVNMFVGKSDVVSLL